MFKTSVNSTLGILNKKIHPLKNVKEDYDRLLDFIGNAEFVLLGEASHGTHEFYRERAKITKRLIEEKGFTAVVVEADWPDAYNINRYVNGIGSCKTGKEALEGFKRFPAWMWRNTDVLDFVEWLRKYNEYNGSLPDGKINVGFYGLDLYSLHCSIEKVIEYLDKTDPNAAKKARERYSCFDYFGTNPQTYGYAANLNLKSSCKKEVILQLRDLQDKAAGLLRQDGFAEKAEELFFAEQNARVVKNAEEYYRSMFSESSVSWNLRDSHMADTLFQLVKFYKQQGKPAKFVVWEHNSHIGNAAATQMSDYGEYNVGQLIREKYGDRAKLIGFTTNSGTVTAASNWGGMHEKKQVLPALENSYERIFHELKNDNFLLLLNDSEIKRALKEPMLERAIGVIYRPDTERMSHYFYSTLPEQFDAVIHIDNTSAVKPLDHSPYWKEDELAETYPFGV